MRLPSERIYAKMCQGWFITHYPKNFVTNRCRANSNTSPDSALDGESGEVFRFALHLFVAKLQASVVIDYPWCYLATYAFRRYVHLASYAFSRWASFGIICSKGLRYRLLYVTWLVANHTELQYDLYHRCAIFSGIHWMFTCFWHTIFYGSCHGCTVVIICPFGICGIDAWPHCWWSKTQHHTQWIW